jgi:hypothetical protein
LETERNFDPDPEKDNELIPDPAPNLQIISDPSGSGCKTLAMGTGTATSFNSSGNYSNFEYKQ